MQSFLMTYGLTLLAIAGAVVTGMRGRRALHFAFVGLTLVGLGFTVGSAEALGRTLVWEGTAVVVRNVHFAVVYATIGFLLAMVATGVGVVRSEPALRFRARARHRRFAWLFVGGVVTSTALGFWMIQVASGGA